MSLIQYYKSEFFRDLILVHGGQAWTIRDSPRAPSERLEYIRHLHLFRWCEIIHLIVRSSYYTMLEEGRMSGYDLVGQPTEIRSHPCAIDSLIPRAAETDWFYQIDTLASTLHGMVIGSLELFQGMQAVHPEAASLLEIVCDGVGGQENGNELLMNCVGQIVLLIERDNDLGLLQLLISSRVEEKMS